MLKATTNSKVTAIGTTVAFFPRGACEPAVFAALRPVSSPSISRAGLLPPSCQMFTSCSMSESNPVSSRPKLSLEGSHVLIQTLSAIAKIVESALGPTFPG